MSILVFSLLVFLTSSYGDKANKKLGNLDSVEYSLDMTSLSYTFEDEKSNDSLELRPVNNIQAGFSLSKNGYSVGFGFEDPTSETTEELGRSKAFDAQFSSTYKRFYIEMFYQKYQGFGLYIDKKQHKVNYKYESFNYGLQGMYFFKKNYDPYESLFHFSHDLKENSSMLLALELSSSMLKNNEGILPTEFSSSYYEFVGVTEVKQSNIALVFGYTQLAKFYENFHTQYLVAVGPNFANNSYSGGSLEDSSKSGSKIILDFDLGYKYKQSVFGISVKSSMTSLQGSRTNKLNTSRLKSQFYYHYFF